MQTFTPKDIGEIIPLDFRFPELSGEDPIVSAIVTAEVWEATGGAADAAPQAIVYGDAERNDSAVQQTIAGGVAGITYLITCKATTAAGYVRIKRGTIAVTGLIVPSAVPPAVTIVPFSGISVGAIIYDDVEIVASPGEINYLSGVTSALQSQLDGKAPLFSPWLIGTPTTPTAALGTSTTQIASTAFVAAQIAASAPGLAPVQSVAGRTGVVVLAKGDVGLGNVDDTSDANKPISTAALAALDLKAPLNNPTLTGTLTTPDIRFSGTTTVGFAPKSLTTVQRDAISSPPPGAVIWNSTDARSNYYNGSAWVTHARLEGDTFTGAIGIARSGIGSSPLLTITGSSATDRSIVQITAGNGASSSRYANVRVSSSETVPQSYVAGMFGSTAYAIRNDTTGATPFSIDASTSLVTLANGLDASTGDVRIKGGKFTAGVITFKNVAGVIQHQIHYRYGSTAASSFVSTINGASGTLSNTPTVGPAVGFIAGVGVSGSAIIFDTAAQTDGDCFIYPNAELNSTGTSYLVQGSRMSSDVGGVMRVRPSIVLRHPTTGAPVTVDTAAIPLNAELSIRFFGFFK